MPLYIDGEFVNPLSPEFQKSQFEAELFMANQNHLAYMYYVGIRYLEGDGVEEDFDKGFEWLNKAADLGYQNAQVVLARLAELANKNNTRHKK